jgi:two-component system, NarL family, invasion response regulator UvrY
MIRLLLVDDHEIVRAGIKHLLSDYREFIVAGEAGTGAHAIKMVHDAEWDVVLLDISMPDMNGIDTLRTIQQSTPELPVLILTVHPEQSYAINLFRAGARGYLQKECAVEQLTSAIHTVASGGRYLSAALRERLANALCGDVPVAAHLELPGREFQVFCKLAAGQTVQEIAQELSSSKQSISACRARVLDMMGMRTDAQLTYYAIMHGLIQ